MKFNKVYLSLILILLTLFSVSMNSFSCMDVIVGKDATVDGSVMTSHTVDGWYDSDLNIRVVPGQKFPEGAMADVYWGLVREEVNQPKKIGEIPQVAETYTYFHDAYSHGNEHQLLIGETTIGVKEEIKTFLGEKAIMTIEQLEAFALQRAKTAREAIKVIAELAETYGFLGSCIENGECLTITDPNEAWVFEIFPVGIGWDPASGKPGAVWAA